MNPHPLRTTFALIVIASLAACAASTKTREPVAPGGGAQVRERVSSSSADAMRLQSSLMAFADTAVSRIAAASMVDTKGMDITARRQLHNTRLALASAMFGIATGTDPVDDLLDMLTHTTLTLDAQRNAARGKPAGSPEARLLQALEQNDADAWKLAAQWVDAPTRDMLRERILATSGARENAGAVSYMRLSDVPRSGGASVAAGEGMFDTMRAATQQADQVRLLAERSMYLMQRMPFLMRWQAQGFAFDTLSMDESQGILKEIAGLTAAADRSSQTIATLPGIIARERRDTLDDLFQHVAAERKAAIDDLAEKISRERAATFAQAADVISAQRKATLSDLTELAGVAGKQGGQWSLTVLFVGVLLIAVLLGGLLGTLLLYRRIAIRLDREQGR